MIPFREVNEVILPYTAEGYSQNVVRGPIMWLESVLVLTPHTLLPADPQKESINKVLNI